MSPDYFVQSSISRDDTAIWEDREDGSNPLSVTLSRTDDGATDAIHPVMLTVDVDTDDDAPVTVTHNGTELHAAPTREDIERAIGAVLFNASNYPDTVKFHVLGRDLSALRNAVTDAVLETIKKG